MCLFIVDDNRTNKDLKAKLLKSYRALRDKRPYLLGHKNRLWHAHDEMFFADSKESVGIQMADLCNYFMWMHLEKNPEPQNFLGIFAEKAVAARPEPEWSQYGNLFVVHDNSQITEKVLESGDDENEKGETAQ